jgi:hypothetical protein
LQLLIWLTIDGRRIPSLFMAGLYDIGLPSFSWQILLGDFSPTPVGLVEYFFVQWLISGALVNGIAQLYLGRQVSPAQAYRFGWRRYLSLIPASIVPLVTRVVIGVAFLIGFTTMVLIFFSLVPFSFSFLTSPFPDAQPAIPALARGAGMVSEPVAILVAIVCGVLVFIPLGLGATWLHARFALFAQAIVLEGRGPLRGLGRSWSLTRRAFRRLIGVVVPISILTYLLAALPTTFLIGVLGFGSYLTGSSVALSLILTLVSLVGALLAQPLAATIYTLLYYDLRVRNEGYDLELMAQREE